MKTLIACLLVLFLRAASASAAAVPCDQASVQAAVSAAVAPATVKLAPGACAWDWLFLPQGITLEGADGGTTVITMPGSGAVNMYTGPNRVTGITFHCATVVWVYGRDWRVDHNTFTCESFTAAVYVTGMDKKNRPSGLIDHNKMFNMRTLIYGYPASSLAEMDATTQWSDPFALGTGRAVYIEDNDISANVFTNSVDCNSGGEYVFRRNTVTDGYVEAHSILFTNRACRKWEIYDNVIKQSALSMYRAFFLRGGSGVAFNNTITGTWGEQTIAIDNERSYMGAGAFGACDGSQPWDGNTEPSGYPCLDQIGRSTDPRPFAGTVPPYPQPQTLDPAYFWGNTINGAPMNVSVDNGADKHIKADRDYVANKGPKPGYVPYVYPHPLQGAVAGPALAWDTAAATYQFTSYTDGAAGVALSGVTCAGTAPVVCQVPFPVLGPGPHAIAITATDAGGESAKSAPYAFDVAQPPPPAPPAPANVRRLP